MAPTVQQLPPQGSSSTTCLLEFPFDTYTDVVEEHTPEREEEEGQPATRWREAGTPSLEFGYKDEPPLGEVPSRWSRWRRYLGRACRVFFVLL
ncbi:hypothetical protein N7474_007911 [Penicillium riverlandense]|uniref:uncharacterized protein n=1 Tax=Penicillium riverlandense TaxID=1903569 RepID=UPI002546AEA0|nr:uncharacterized protein N7474_007911 [Penicillium riverlandense]KAJ5811610.1 hypothetical protein N7474_007911 [Penicillium riverlandense]